MYGFTEEHPNNIFDNVEIPSKYFVQAIKSLNLNEQHILDKKCDIFYELSLIDESASFIISNDGILNEEEILQVLQVISIFFFILIKIF